MPKTSAPRNQSYAYKSGGKVLSSNKNKSDTVEEGYEKARIRVGDSNLKYLKGAKDSEPVYPDTDTLEKRQVETARKFNMRKTLDKAKARALKAGISRIKDDDMDDAIEMVRKAKTARRTAY